MVGRRKMGFRHVDGRKDRATDEQATDWKRKRT